MEGESGSSSQPGTTSITSTVSLPSSATPTSSTGGVASTIGALPTTVGSAQQNPQQNPIQLGAAVAGVPVAGQHHHHQQQQPISSSGQAMHQNMMPNFQPGQSRPGMGVNRSRQHPTAYTHFSSLASSTAMHQQRGGIQMQGMGAQQRPQGLGGPTYAMPRGAMMGQPQGTPNSSMIPPGQTDQVSSMQSQYPTHQGRQKSGSIQVPPFQHPASSGQTLAGIPSMSTVGSHPLGTQMRPIGAFGPSQPRPVQGTSRVQSPSQHQMINQQKMHISNLQRNASAGSMGSQLPGMSQGGQANQQQWMQGKQMHPSGVSSISSPYQSHLKQQNIQQRQHGQTQQQSLSLTPQQQQHQAQLLQEQQSQQFQQQRTPQSLHVSQQQQMSRTAGTGTQKIPAGAQAGTTASGNAAPARSNDQITETNNRILGKRNIQDLVDQIDPREKLDPEVEDILIEIAEDFLDRVATSACGLAKHRKSETLEPKDIMLPLERHWHITVPGFAGDEYRTYKRPSVNENHKQRLAVIRRSVAASQTGTETGNTKSSTGQVTGNANIKVPAIKGSQEPPAADEHP